MSRAFERAFFVFGSFCLLLGELFCMFQLADAPWVCLSATKRVVWEQDGSLRSGLIFFAGDRVGI